VTYRVELSKRAASYVRRADRPAQERIRNRLREIGTHPHDPGLSAPLQGRNDGLRRSRVGNLRILFYVDDQVRVVDVTEIGPRGDIYKS
jgi:mRNA interferase RelE/StbE